MKSLKFVLLLSVLFHTILNPVSGLEPIEIEYLRSCIEYNHHMIWVANCQLGLETLALICAFLIGILATCCLAETY